MYSIYKHTFPDGKVYIGCTSVRPELRYGRDGEGYSKQRKLWDAIQECGWVNVGHEVLKQTISRDEASACEQAYIQQYDSTNPDKGYNTRTGGLGRLMGALPPGTGQKISEGKTGTVSVHKDGLIRYVRPESLAEYLELGWERGMPARVIELIRQSRAGIKHSEESNLKRASSLKGKNVGKRQIHKAGVRKLVPASELNQYLQNGWELGTGRR